MSRIIIGGSKDANGIFVKTPESPILEPTLKLPNPDVNLDDIAKRIVVALDRATKELLTQISSGDVSREVIGALKDCEAMHRELAKKEKDFLDGASDEQLKNLLK
jgi:hypothetical protein